MEQLHLTDSIIELNRDMEPFIVQGSASRPRPFKDKYAALQFIHFTDVHYRLDMWNRLVEYMNHYSEYIAFAIHTGDYCGSSQLSYTDLYNEGIPSKRVIYNCIGNHDTCVHNDKTLNNRRSTKEGVHKLLFNRTENWDVEFMPGDFSMTYYKDFPESNVRLVVLDCYYDVEQQLAWLEYVLKEAKEKGLHVITASHELTDYICSPADTPFHTANDYTLIPGEKENRSPFEGVIEAFVNEGGIHVIHLAGHTHNDRFGQTEAGILNTAVECATTFDGWCDGKRVEGTRTFDAFNAVSVDANVGVITLARIGDNVDHYLRFKKSLCYDYVNKKLIYT